METDTAFDAGEAIKSALRTIEGLSVYDDPAAPMRPPAALVGAPALRAEVGSEISAATFPVAIAVSSKAKAVPTLLKLVPQAISAVETFVADASVHAVAEPITLQVEGQDELPAYLLMIDVSI